MIEVEHLVKKYGSLTAVDDLNMKIEPGRIYGLLGKNGAGKTTTMNMMTGYIGATSGTVKVCGHDIFKEAEAAKREIGYLPEIPPLYTDMTVYEYLSFCAELKGIGKKERDDSVVEVMEKTGVAEMEGRLIRNLSKGYRQRVGLAQAIMGNPSIIILDEPTVGLDPVQMIEMRDLIQELGKEHTVILSSHILSEVSAVCDYIFIISDGKLVANDTTENLTQRMNRGQQTIMVTIKGDAARAQKLLSDLEHVDHVTIQQSEEEGTALLAVTAKGREDIREEISLSLSKAGIAIFAMKENTQSLEDVFIELTEKEDEE